MFTPDSIKSLGMAPGSQGDVIDKLASTIHGGAGGGSTKLRSFLSRARSGVAQYVSDADAKYLANEANYLWTRSVGRLGTVSPPRASEPSIFNTSVETHTPVSAKALINEPRSTAAWVNNTLYFCHRINNGRMKQITADAVRNLLAAEVGATSSRINANKVNGIGYMGAFQMGKSEWANNRHHGFSEVSQGCPSSVAADYAKRGARTGPSDVLVAPAVWARYISKTINLIPAAVFSRSLTDGVYCVHNIGPGHLKSLSVFARGGRMNITAAWAMLTQLGYTSWGKSKYRISLRKSRRATSRTSRPLRAFMNVLRAEGNTMSEAAFIEALIAACRKSRNAYRLIA